MDIKQEVRDFRRSAGWSQTELGRRIGKSLNTVQRYETLVAPTGRSLVDIASVAAASGHPAFAKKFMAALASELGLPAIARMSPPTEPSAP